MRARQQAVQCDDCKKWQHRTCGTGITQATYRLAVKRLETIKLSCLPCQVQRSPQPAMDEINLFFSLPPQLSPMADLEPMDTSPPPGFAPLLFEMGTFVNLPAPLSPLADTCSPVVPSPPHEFQPLPRSRIVLPDLCLSPPVNHSTPCPIGNIRQQYSRSGSSIKSGPFPLQPCSKK